jgi:hypothetical protein
MDDFDRFWEWANKAPRRRLTSAADLHHAVTSPPLKDWYDRDKANEAVRKLREAVDKNPTPHRP